jgi:predicted CXXCH cytochrome family protein
MPSKIRTKKKGIPRILVLLGLFYGILIYFPGCSVSKNYKTLAFFFDGVPAPVDSSAMKTDSLRLSDSTLLSLRADTRKVSTVNMHSPYQDKQCGSCHDQGKMGKLLTPQPGLCYTCHEDFSLKYRHLHGPVGGGACTSCHSPHSSSNDHLLQRTGQALCLYCHDKTSLLETQSHRDMGETSCTECHNPHGSDKSYSLR